MGTVLWSLSLSLPFSLSKCQVTRLACEAFERLLKDCESVSLLASFQALGCSAQKPNQKFVLFYVACFLVGHIEPDFLSHYTHQNPDAFFQTTMNPQASRSTGCLLVQGTYHACCCCCSFASSRLGPTYLQSLQCLAHLLSSERDANSHGRIHSPPDRALLDFALPVNVDLASPRSASGAGNAARLPLQLRRPCDGDILVSIQAASNQATHRHCRVAPVRDHRGIVDNCKSSRSCRICN